MTQNEIVLERLKKRKKKGLTQLEALTLDGVGRLSARIWDLRHKYGIDIEEDSVAVQTRNGVARVARYRLGGVSK